MAAPACGRMPRGYTKVSSRGTIYTEHGTVYTDWHPSLTRQLGTGNARDNIIHTSIDLTIIHAVKQ